MSLVTCHSAKNDDLIRFGEFRTLTMEQDEVVLEEGELSDDSDTYTPLERPADYSGTQPHSRFPVVVPESESEFELQSSDSDSDSDCNRKRNKKPRIKLKPRFQEQKRKKYDIWSTRVQEDVLAETLNSCDVTIKDRSRDVESYDYLSHRVSNKRTRDDRRNPNIKSVGRPRSQERQKGNSRAILDLAVDVSNTPEEIAQDIANKLSEEKEDLILKVINTLGVDKTLVIFKETKRIEEEGGMLIMNQTRRRTPGGVFLFLVRHDYDITPEQRCKIFDDEKEKAKIMMRNKQKKKMKKMKEEIAASKNKLLPDLLTRAQLLAKENNRVRKETDERDVINPPPTPETDGHDNSGDGMDVPDNRRKLETYDDDFLDINCSNDMDLF